MLITVFPVISFTSWWLKWHYTLFVYSLRCGLFLLMRNIQVFLLNTGWTAKRLSISVEIVLYLCLEIFRRTKPHLFSGFGPMKRSLVLDILTAGKNEMLSLF